MCRVVTLSCPSGRRQSWCGHGPRNGAPTTESPPVPLADGHPTVPEDPVLETATLTFRVAVGAADALNKVMYAKAGSGLSDGVTRLERSSVYET